VQSFPFLEAAPPWAERGLYCYERVEGAPIRNGPANCLARNAARYWQRGHFLRIHGTNQPSTIGQAVSNGCARLVNDHVIEPYKKVPMGTKVYLYPRAGNPYSPDQHGMDHHS